MIKKIFTATSEEITINIPLNWQGKELELLVFPCENANEEADFKDAQEQISENLCDAACDNFKHLNVLLAEDNELNQKIISRVLQSFFNSVTVVSNGEEAFKARQNNDFDIIFMDLAMPKINGVVATKNIRKYEQENELKAVFIVALSMSFKQDELDRYIQQGFNSCLFKPVQKSELLKILDDFTCANEKTHEDFQLKMQEKEQEEHEDFGLIELKNSMEDFKEEDIEENPPLDEPSNKPCIDVVLCKKSPLQSTIVKNLLKDTSYDVQIAQNIDELEKMLELNEVKFLVLDYQDILSFDLCMKIKLSQTYAILLADKQEYVDQNIIEQFNQFHQELFGQEELKASLQKILSKSDEL